MRVNAYIDGFNLYHAICGMGQAHLKWVNLKQLSSIFTSPQIHHIKDIYYFSAYATWLPAAYARHRQYIAALKTVGVIPVLGHFKVKDRSCRKCGGHWKAHEEKETDINIALHLLQHACEDRYDLALLMSADSDLVPAVKMVREKYPSKKIKIFTPANHGSCKALVREAGGNHAAIRETHVQRSLFPEIVLNATGKIAARCPSEYVPP